MQDSRFENGMKLITSLDPEAGDKVFDQLSEVSPDLARFTVEYGFGDIYSRPGLELKQREIATVAALTAMGNATPQLKLHLNLGLNNGCTETELMEVIIQMSVYAGFPAALNAMFAFKEVMEERKQNAE